jgi:hypothetical protein
MRANVPNVASAAAPNPTPATSVRVGELGLDQRLIDRLGRVADPVTDIGDLEYL